MSGLKLEVHTIIAVQFTEARAVAEARVGEDTWVPIARADALLNNVAVSKRHWEYLVYCLDMGPPTDLHLLAVGNVEVRVTISLHGRLGNAAVGSLNQVIPVRIIDGYVPDLSLPDFEIYEDENMETAESPDEVSELGDEAEDAWLVDMADATYSDDSDESEDESDDGLDGGYDDSYEDENQYNTALEVVDDYFDNVNDADYVDESDGYETP
ncbi:hypothetical protein SEPCBS119000_000150 [Sporothrix epigloea]|uniref:Uncharacterized protein n=1 Tax=Sporothrix epigloea TaxID=1892477 RepID=A0ABP0D3G3_9PEZI